MRKCYHVPAHVAWSGEIPSEENGRLERALLFAVARAIKSRAEGDSEIVTMEMRLEEDIGDLFESSRYRPRNGTYDVPSYGNDGALTPVPITFELERITSVLDRVIEQEPPFQGALVLALPGTHYVKVAAHRYATTSDPTHAVLWGRLLFGPTTWVVVSRAQQSGEKLYYVAGLEERLTEADLRVHPFASGSKIPSGVTGTFSGRVLSSLPGDYMVESVYFADGGRTAPSPQAFSEFRSQMAAAREQGSMPLDPATVRTAVFRQIDLLLASGSSDDLERAADLLAELDATAFSLLDSPTRVRYLTALVQAWTSEPQEKAILEIFKSVADRKELDAIIKQLRSAGIWEQLFDDLDNELWSLLIAIGQKFGDKSPLSFDALFTLLLEAKLLSVTPGVRLTDTGIEISYDVVAEAYEAARGFIRTVGDFFKSIWMFIAHPDKLIDTVGQLAKMSLTMQLAMLGHEESRKAVQEAVASIGQQALFALKGAAVIGTGEAIERRMRWAIIWEVASWFIGVGEIKAAAQAIGVTERLQAIGRILRALGLAGKVAEGERAAVKLQTLARLISRSSKTLAQEEVALRFLARLPDEDLARLGSALERLELTEATNLTRLIETNSDVGNAFRKAEALGEFSAKAGGLTDDVAEAFARLSRHGRLGADEIGGLLHAVPEGQHARFARAVRAIPPTAFGEGSAASADFLIALAESPQRAEAMLQMGYGSFAAVYRRASGDAAKLDEYLGALAKIEQKLPPTNRAAEFRRLLDQLEGGDPQAWLVLEEARAGEFAPGAGFSVSELKGITRTRVTGSGRQITSLDDIPLTAAERQAARRIHGQKLTDSLRQAWQNTVNPREITDLAEVQRLLNLGRRDEAATLAREVFDRHRARFWGEVRRNPALAKQFEDAGMVFPSGRGAPVYVDPVTGAPSDFMSIEHSQRLTDNPQRCTDSSNLQFVLGDENSYFLEWIRANDPFQ